MYRSGLRGLTAYELKSAYLDPSTKDCDVAFAKAETLANEQEALTTIVYNAMYWYRSRRRIRRYAGQAATYRIVILAANA